MSGFSVDWLDLREAADQRARDDELLKKAKHWLKSDPASSRGSNVVDLGAGTGSTLRAFIGSGDSESNTSHWILVDQDADLLAEARRRHGSSQPVETCERDLGRISELPLAGARLVTASALFDLVSAEFIDALATDLQGQSQKQPVGLYAALNYDGTTRWTPTHPLDGAVLAAFNRDQRRDKGLGPALGPDACDYLERKFTEADFNVFSASSPWILNRANSALVEELIKGITAAVADDPALDSKSLLEWTEFRLDNVTTGSCIVGHRDLLALPESESLHLKNSLMAGTVE